MIRFASIAGDKHGTRSCYVKGCRCAPCKESNRLYYHQREKQRAEQLVELAATSRGHVLGAPEPASAPQVWTAPNGSTQVRLYKHACPGVEGAPCPTASHLRKDSKGGVCGGCRNRLTFRGRVDADRARAHLLKLSKAGIGRRAVQAACDVGDTTLQLIRKGTSKFIYAEIEKRILSVDINARADGSLVDGGPTRRLIKALKKLGMTQTEIAGALGSEADVPALQLKRSQVRASSELAVKRLFEQKMREKGLEPRAGRRGRPKLLLCPRCQQAHGDDKLAADWCRQNMHVPVDVLEVA